MRTDTLMFEWRCDVCRKRARGPGVKDPWARLPLLTVKLARYRVFFGSYGSSGWALCEEHYAPLLDEKIPFLVVREGLECHIVELVPDPDYPGDFIHRSLATIRSRSAHP